jgi:hypothetical protein
MIHTLPSTPKTASRTQYISRTCRSAAMLTVVLAFAIPTTEAYGQAGYLSRDPNVIVDMSVLEETGLPATVAGQYLSSVPVRTRRISFPPATAPVSRLTGPLPVRRFNQAPAPHGQVSAPPRPTAAPTPTVTARVRAPVAAASTQVSGSTMETPPRNSWIEDGWAISVYGGTVSTSDTSKIFAGSGDFGDATVLGVAVSKRIVRLFDHINLAGELQINRHFDHYDTWEFVVVPKFTFFDFPWDDTVVTTFSVGDGLSYTNKLAAAEVDTHTSSDANRLLNFVLLEATLALPEHDQWALDLRYHHRSGIFGLFSGVTEASTMLAIGLRRNF